MKDPEDRHSQIEHELAFYRRECSDLGRRVSRLQDELKSARAEANEAGGLRSRFLSTFSHELRTPLNSIIGFSEIMKESGSKPMPLDKYVEYADHIFKSSRHLLNLINGILDFSRIAASADELDEQTVNLLELISSAVENVKTLAKAKDIITSLDVVERPPSIRADPRRIRKVLTSILSNAIKFSPPASTVSISVRRLANDSGLRIDIADQGIGIGNGELDKVFEPFFQSGEPYLSETVGTGLGLSLSKALIEAHQGNISIRSVKDRGTVVTLTLPEARLIETNVPELP